MEIIDNILEVSLMKKFENFELQANVQFKRGISAIFAPSGTGKTTLLKLITLLKCVSSFTPIPRQAHYTLL